MKQTFTSASLIEYIYGELQQSGEYALEQELRQNPALNRELQDLHAGLDQLEDIEAQPSALSVQRILDYSRGSRAQAKNF